MPHVSKQKLDKETLNQISERLITIIIKLQNKDEAVAFLEDLLTKTERIMLAKRLAITIMLERGYPFQVISRSLKVSEATISVMRDRIDRGGRGFKNILEKLEKDRSIEKLLKILDTIISAFAMPPITGKSRWKFLYK